MPVPVRSFFLPLYCLFSSLDEFPLTNQKGFPIVPGHQHYISLSAVSIDADDNIRKLDRSSRNCSFSDETQDLIIHKKYSQSNCFLECSILYAQSSMIRSNHSACTPWYLPFTDENHKVCDPWGAQYFLFWFQSINHATECSHCLPDCKHTLYKHKTTTEPLRNCDEINFGVSKLCLYNDISISLNFWGRNALDDLDNVSMTNAHQSNSLTNNNG